MGDNRHHLAENVRRLRDAHGLTKGQLGKIVGSTGMQIGLIERNEVANPSYFMIEALADFFGVGVRQLMRDDVTALDPQARLLHSFSVNITGLSQEAQAVLLHNLESTIKVLNEKEHFSMRKRQINTRSKKTMS